MDVLPDPTREQLVEFLTQQRGNLAATARFARIPYGRLYRLVMQYDLRVVAAGLRRQPGMRTGWSRGADASPADPSIDKVRVLLWLFDGNATAIADYLQCSQYQARCW